MRVLHVQMQDLERIDDGLDRGFFFFSQIDELATQKV